MKSQLHTILGANGATGIGIIEEFKIRNHCPEVQITSYKDGLRDMIETLG